MLNKSDGNYNPKANAIFRNQPQHSYFDMKLPINDVLSLDLNEIEEHFLNPEQAADNRAFINQTSIDPRTRKAIEVVCYDHTVENKTESFNCPEASSINATDQAQCMRVLLSVQEGFDVNANDLALLKYCEPFRLTEKQQFFKFIYEYNKTQKEVMYAPTKRLMHLYRKWYRRKALKLMEKYPAASYNTYLGLPDTRLCKNPLNDQLAIIANKKILKHEISILKKPANSSITLKNLNFNLESIYDEFLNSEDLSDELENQMQQEFLKYSQMEAERTKPMLYIPMECLLLLLCSGDYIDTPTEMMISIEEKGHEGIKVVAMDTPFPARECGWHTHKRIMEQSLVAYLSTPGKFEWQKQTNSLLKDTENEAYSAPEIDGTHKRESPDYKTTTMEEFMKTCSLKLPQFCKFSNNLVKWNFSIENAEEDTEPFQLFTTVSTQMMHENQYDKSAITLINIKPEYKPKFGCEIMTKYELLQEWFRLTLLNITTSKCLRVNLKDFQILLEENLTLAKIEEQLLLAYNVKMKEMLSSLYEFLKLLQTMPTGKHLLRYNTKYKNKLLFCQLSKEITQNTLHLHDLLKTEPSELLFLEQHNFLPISDSLCSLMHMQHQLIPCCFKPLAYGSKRRPYAQKLTDDKCFQKRRIQGSKGRPIAEKRTDDKCFQKQLIQFARIREQKTTGMSKCSKQQKKRQNKTAKKLAEREQNTDQNELQRQMAIDSKMLGVENV